MVDLVWLGRVGLLLDLIGACFLWRGGTPPVYRPRWAVIAPNDVEPEEQAEAKWQTMVAGLERRNMIGVVLLVGGFALQLIGTWASR